MSTSGDKTGTRQSRSGSVILSADALKKELNSGSDNFFKNNAWDAAVNRLKMYCAAYGLVYNDPDYGLNSFFAAVSDQLSFLGSPYQGSFLQLRIDTVKVIKQVRKDSICSKVKAYLKTMEEPTTPVDHYVIFCMARLLQRDILIIRSYPETNVPVLRVEGADNPDTEPLVLGYSYKYRFHSLKPVDRSINPKKYVDDAQVLEIHKTLSRADDAYINAAQEQAILKLKEKGSELGYDFMIFRKLCILHAIAEQLRSRFYPNQPEKLYSRVASALRQRARRDVSSEKLERFLDRIKCETDEDCGSQCSAFNNISKTAHTVKMTAHVLFTVAEIIGHDINIVLIKDADERAVILQVRATPTSNSSKPLILGHVFGQQFLIMEPYESTLYSTIGTTKGKGLVTGQTPIKPSTRTSASPTTKGQVPLTGHGGQKSAIKRPRGTVQSLNEPGEPQTKKSKQDEIVTYLKNVKDVLSACERNLQVCTRGSLYYGLNRLKEMEMDILDKTGKLLTMEDGNHILAPLWELLQKFRHEINTRQLAPLTDHQKMKVKEVLEQSSGQPADIIATCKKFSYKLTNKDMRLLRPRGWLNDQVINYYMQLIQLRGKRKGLPTVLSLNSCFFGRLEKRQSVRKWIKTDIFKNDFIVIPMSVNGNHWCLAIIDFEAKAIRYYDSLGGRAFDFHFLCNFLDAEALHWRGSSFDFKDWKWEVPQGLPWEEVPGDCGVFVCAYAKYATGRLQITFKEKDMPYFRERMVYELVSNMIE